MTAITRFARVTGIPSVRTGDAVRPVRVALPPDAPLVPGHVEHPLVLRPGEGADHVVMQRRGARWVGRIWAMASQPVPSLAGAPQDQVGEGQVGEKLPVRHQRVQVLDVGLAEAGVAPGQVVQRGHSIIIASGGEFHSSQVTLGEPTGPFGPA